MVLPYLRGLGNLNAVQKVIFFEVPFCSFREYELKLLITGEPFR